MRARWRLTLDEPVTRHDLRPCAQPAIAVRVALAMGLPRWVSKLTLPTVAEPTRECPEPAKLRADTLPPPVGVSEGPPRLPFRSW